MFKLVLLCGCWLLAACAPLQLTPVNPQTAAGRWLTPEQASAPVLAPAPSLVIPANFSANFSFNGPVNGPANVSMTQGATQNVPPDLSWAPRMPPLSPGDRVRLALRDGEDFAGVYEVQMDGSLHIPYLPALQVAGLTPGETEALLRETLVRAGYFRPGLIAMSLDVQQWAAVEIYVSGAVFAPGRVVINQRPAEERMEQSQLMAGDAAMDRVLEAALRSAGGVRPDADLAKVLLQRDGDLLEVDLRAVLWGYPVPALPLMSGDRIHVPSTGLFSEELVKPSVITPPGMRVFLSNLTIPAPANSLSGVNQNSTSLPYGSRLLTGLLSANCVGGVAATNSSRHAVLISHNPLSGEQEVIARPVEEILASPHRSDLNPLLMPNDGIACYDSGVTNLRDLARTMADLLLPFRTGI